MINQRNLFNYIISHKIHYYLYVTVLLYYIIIYTNFLSMRVFSLPRGQNALRRYAIHTSLPYLQIYSNYNFASYYSMYIHMSYIQYHETAGGRNNINYSVTVSSPVVRKYNRRHRCLRCLHKEISHRWHPPLYDGHQARQQMVYYVRARIDDVIITTYGTRNLYRKRIIFRKIEEQHDVQ